MKRQRETHMDAISAKEAPIAKVSVMATIKPYTADAGPPLVYPLTNTVLVASLPEG